MRINFVRLARYPILGWERCEALKPTSANIKCALPFKFVGRVAAHSILIEIDASMLCFFSTICDVVSITVQQFSIFLSLVIQYVDHSFRKFWKL